jgi:CD2 antigen cytoplasmic tail-binding protein 2
VRREGIEDEDDDTHIDASTSLLSDNKDSYYEVNVEPFNMDAEQNDGSGYFDGDTYVFRKRDVDEEPDAWLESLAENKQVASIPTKEEDKSGGMEMDDWSQEELYAKIIPLVSDTESVLQAVARYGGLLKRRKTSERANAENGTCIQMAQRALNDLTEAANALLLKGDVDVYQRTRNDFMKLIPDTKTAASKEVVTWEYRGNQDGELHGPYTTAQMMSWIQAGYFIGEQAVQIRTISKEDKISTVDDLLSDLMDDDEADGEDKEVKGEWKSSNDVDFSAYA